MKTCLTRALEFITYFTSLHLLIERVVLRNILRKVQKSEVGESVFFFKNHLSSANLQSDIMFEKLSTEKFQYHVKQKIGMYFRWHIPIKLKNNTLKWYWNHYKSWRWNLYTKKQINIIVRFLYECYSNKNCRNWCLDIKPERIHQNCNFLDYMPSTLITALFYDDIFSDWWWKNCRGYQSRCCWKWRSGLPEICYTWTSIPVFGLRSWCVGEVKFLGVHPPTWRRHIGEVTSKVNRNISFIWEPCLVSLGEGCLLGTWREPFAIRNCRIR